MLSAARSAEKGFAPMTIDTQHFRIELLEERERVQAALANLRESHPGSLDDEVEEVAATSDNHLGETATATLGREIDYTLGENSGQVLTEIDQALARIEQGTYGKCTACGREIGEERLEAYPWASLCIDDARKAERR
jgi:RNA polymerase-binding protein DksA